MGTALRRTGLPARPIGPRRAALLLGVLACTACTPSSGGCHDSAGRADESAVPTVTLRFQPPEGAQYREHWVYDLSMPGEGLRRDGLSFDVGTSRMDQGSYAVRHVVRKRLAFQNGHALPEHDLQGVSISHQWGSDHSVVAELGVSASSLELETALRSLVEMASFGRLIEYPDQAIGVRDSWSIEPRTRAVPGGLSATLRPTYTLEAIEKRPDGLEAVIAVDMQVDLIPHHVVEGVVIEGGGSASGTLRVSVADGVLRDARAVLHFSQEILVPGNEVLGFREISATAHVFTTPNSQQPDLAAQPVTLEPLEDDRDCEALLSAAAQRLGSTEGRQRVHLVSALHGDGLPAAHGGRALRDSGMSLVVRPEPRPIELDGTSLHLKDLPAALRASKARRTLYIYADAALPLDRLRSAVAVLPRRSDPRLVVRDPSAAAPPPKASRWLEGRLRHALAASEPLDRQMKLHSVLLSHLVLCEPAEESFRTAISTEEPEDLPAHIVQAFTKCGCTTTNLEGLEATLLAIFGSPDLRALALPRAADDPRWTRVSTVQELATLLGGVHDRNQSGEAHAKSLPRAPATEEGSAGL